MVIESITNEGEEPVGKGRDKDDEESRCGVQENVGAEDVGQGEHQHPHHQEDPASKEKGEGGEENNIGKESFFLPPQGINHCMEADEHCKAEERPGWIVDVC